MTILLLSYSIVKIVSIPMMYGMIMIIIPLFPALNILFPVGTILAERLLFIPSIGFTLIVGEILTVNLGEVWMYIGSYEVTIMKGMNSLSLLVLPLLLLASCRIVTRNLDWNSELALYSSALDVCPHSVKGLSNYASLCFATGQADLPIELAKRAIDIGGNLVQPHVNAGVGYQRKGHLDKAIHYFQVALTIDKSNGKAHGYIGGALLDWSGLQSTNDIKTDMLVRASISLDKAIYYHNHSPSVLHSRGFAAFELGYYDQSLIYYHEAIKLAKIQLSQSQDMPFQDSVNIGHTYIQLGNVYYKLGNYLDAIDAFITSTTINPAEVACYLNLGNAYKELQNYQQAKDSYTKALELLLSSSLQLLVSKSSTIAAVYNNLALLEMQQQNYQNAKEFLFKAQEYVDSHDNTNYSGFSAGKLVHDDSLDNIVKKNIIMVNKELGLHSEL